MCHLQIIKLRSTKSSWAEILNQLMYLSSHEDIIGYASHLPKITQFKSEKTEEDEVHVTHLLVRVEFNVFSLGGQEPVYDWGQQVWVNILYAVGVCKEADHHTHSDGSCHANQCVPHVRYPIDVQWLFPVSEIITNIRRCSMALHATIILTMHWKRMWKRLGRTYFKVESDWAKLRNTLRRIIRTDTAHVSVTGHGSLR